MCGSTHYPSEEPSVEILPVLHQPCQIKAAKYTLRHLANLRTKDGQTESLLKIVFFLKILLPLNEREEVLGDLVCPQVLITVKLYFSLQH